MMLTSRYITVLVFSTTNRRMEGQSVGNLHRNYYRIKLNVNQIIIVEIKIRGLCVRDGWTT